MTKTEEMVLCVVASVTITTALSLLYQIAKSLEALVRQLKALRRGDQTTEIY